MGRKKSLTVRKHAWRAPVIRQEDEKMLSDDKILPESDDKILPESDDKILPE